jgi:hypothetical protein
MWSCQVLKERRLPALNLPKGRLAWTSCAEKKGPSKAWCGFVKPSAHQSAPPPNSRCPLLAEVSAAAWACREALSKVTPRKHGAEAIYFSASNAFSHGAVTIAELGHLTLEGSSGRENAFNRPGRATEAARVLFY